MQVKCALCDKICRLDDQSMIAKRLRNRPIHTYLCDTCNKRISERTRARWATGKFTLHLPVNEGKKKTKHLD
ncbi:YlaI family protein [Sporolactobacillus shoreicorticis]|uniref:YlaI family protein n=1 Tax=Sporolactobacillus shoreicorticis TaxID=1923877 RepID=A0ABW5S6S2_9BACL|nr:YlaI family protein [Sporolactobacillus shoreicorticis]MCO7126269.1 YlaI family protein [Sporolactobacillus shoreicorticis]